MHSSAFQIQYEEQIVRDQPALGPDFYRGEVDHCQDAPVSLKEGISTGSWLSDWSWIDAVSLEDVADRGIRVCEPDVGQGARDAIVAPGGILFGEL